MPKKDILREVMPKAAFEGLGLLNKRGGSLGKADLCRRRGG